MGWPSRRTVEAPHSRRSQTRLVPVKSSWLRRTSSRVQRGSTLTRKVRPFTRSLMGRRGRPEISSSTWSWAWPSSGASTAAVAPAAIPCRKRRRGRGNSGDLSLEDMNASSRWFDRPKNFRSFFLACHSERSEESHRCPRLRLRFFVALWAPQNDNPTRPALGLLLQRFFSGSPPGGLGAGHGDVAAHGDELGHDADPDLFR